MAKLAGGHHDLSPMMALMRYEVREHVPDIERQVAPDVALRGRKLSACIESELEKRLDTPGTPLQR